MKASTHLHDLENIVYDMILVCRKREEEDVKSRSWKSIKGSINRSVLKMVTQLKKEGEAPTQVDTFTMIFGKSLELYSKHYPRVMESGETIDPERALETIDDLLGGL